MPDDRRQSCDKLRREPAGRGNVPRMAQQSAAMSTSTATDRPLAPGPGQVLSVRGSGWHDSHGRRAARARAPIPSDRRGTGSSEPRSPGRNLRCCGAARLVFNLAAGMLGRCPPVRLAHWRTRNELRRRYQRPRPGVDANGKLANIVDGDPPPFEVVAGEERRAAAQTAVAVLPRPHCPAVTLALLEERTHEELVDVAARDQVVVAVDPSPRPRCRARCATLDYRRAVAPC